MYFVWDFHSSFFLCTNVMKRSHKKLGPLEVIWPPPPLTIHWFFIQDLSFERSFWTDAIFGYSHEPPHWLKAFCLNSSTSMIYQGSSMRIFGENSKCVLLENHVEIEKSGQNAFNLCYCRVIAWLRFCKKRRLRKKNQSAFSAAVF